MRFAIACALLVALSCQQDTVSITISAPPRMADATVSSDGHAIGTMQGVSGDVVIAQFTVARGTSEIRLHKAGYRPVSLKIPETESREIYLDVDASAIIAEDFVETNTTGH